MSLLSKYVQGLDLYVRRILVLDYTKAAIMHNIKMCVIVRSHVITGHEHGQDPCKSGQVEKGFLGAVRGLTSSASQKAIHFSQFQALFWPKCQNILVLMT